MFRLDHRVARVRRVPSAAALFWACALVVGGGCAERQARPAPNRIVTPDVIAVGQPWADALGAAARAGYVVFDDAGLAPGPGPNGFSLALAEGRGLLVRRDDRRDAVRSVEWVTSWPAAKRPAAYYTVNSYALPRTGATAASRPAAARNASDHALVSVAIVERLGVVLYNSPEEWRAALEVPGLPKAVAERDDVMRRLRAALDAAAAAAAGERPSLVVVEALYSQNDPNACSHSWVVAFRDAGLAPELRRALVTLGAKPVGPDRWAAVGGPAARLTRPGAGGDNGLTPRFHTQDAVVVTLVSDGRAAGAAWFWFGVADRLDRGGDLDAPADKPWRTYGALLGALDQAGALPRGFGDPEFPTR